MRYNCITNVGNIRENNEDYYLVFQKENELMTIFIVADGMGGHNAGEIASKYACKLLLGYLQLNIEKLKQSPFDMIEKGFTWVNNKLFRLQYDYPNLSGMGTTLSMALLIDNKLIIANVGDSRVYRITYDEILQITEDHSLVYQMYKEGKITKEEINTHPQKNIITRAVGVTENINVDVFEQEMKNDSYILMCTDGLTNMLTEDYIHGIFKTYSFDDIGEILVKKAIEKGGFDNITVIYFKL